MYIKCLIHELRTPISNVTLGLNSMEIKIKKEQEEITDIDCNCIEFLSTISDLYKSLNYIDNTLTKFCVIQDGVMILNNFKPFSIRILLQNVQKILWYNIKEKNIQFEYNIDNDIHDLVYGDKINIKHCIINLIKNAIKYNNNQNNSKIIINISYYNNISIAESQNKNIIISIIDNNNYIPKNIKDKLFQPFNSTSGSGLGLYICKKILDLHNGSIEHEYVCNQDNPSNQGNKFNIIINLENCDNIPLFYEEKDDDYNYTIMSS